MSKVKLKEHDISSYDIVEWLCEHSQAYRDCLDYFGAEDGEDLEEVSHYDLLDWIKEHGELYRDFLTYFDIEAPQNEEEDENYGGYNNTPAYAVYELDENDDELDHLEDFDSEEEAIEWAKAQEFPTHVVCIPTYDPDDDGSEELFVDAYGYEPYEVVWSSLEEGRLRKSFNCNPNFGDGEIEASKFNNSTASDISLSESEERVLEKDLEEAYPMTTIDYIEEALNEEDIPFAYNSMENSFTFNPEDYSRGDDIICNIVGDNYWTDRKNNRIFVEC